MQDTAERQGECKSWHRAVCLWGGAKGMLECRGEMWGDMYLIGIGGAVLEAAAHTLLFLNKQLTLRVVLLHVSEGPASLYCACVVHPALLVQP
eukprot:1000446-Pelagomonas_calceolata.AAC.2